MDRRNSEIICERKILFRIKNKLDQAGFKNKRGLNKKEKGNHRRFPVRVGGVVQ